MKGKNYVVTVVLVSAMSAFCGCGEARKAKVPQTDIETVDTATTSADPVSQEMIAVSVAEICEDYLSSDPQLEAFYSEIGEGWIKIGQDSYYPSAVYDGDWQDFSQVVQSFRDKSQPWARRSGDWFIWSSDYEHQFAVYDYDPYWLQLDDVVVAPLTEETFSMNPAELINDYQSGKWDGEKRFSADYCTAAELNPHTGRIDYWYERPLSYTDEENFGFLPENCSGPEYLNYQDVTVIEETWTSGYGKDKVEYGEAKSMRYVDLPTNLTLEPLEAEWADDKAGTFFLTRDGVSQYCKGKLIQQWDYHVAKYNKKKSNNPFIAVIDADSDDMYLNTGRDFVRLHADGTTEVLLQGVRDASYNYEGTIDVVALQDGVLSLGYRQHDGRFSVYKVSNHVIDAVEVCNVVYFKKKTSGVHVDAYQVTFPTYAYSGISISELTAEEADDVLHGTEFNPVQTEKVKHIKQFMKSCLRSCQRGVSDNVAGQI